MAAAVVELDALADAVGPAAEDHHPLPARLLRRHFVFVLVGRIVIGGVGLELRGAGVDRFEGGHDAAALAIGADVHLRGVPDGGQLAVGKAGLLGLAQLARRRPPGEPSLPKLLFHLHQFLEVLQEPGIDVGELEDLLDRHPVFEGVAEEPGPAGVGAGQLVADLFQAGLLGGAPQVAAVAAETEASHLQPPQGLLKRFLERAADGHRLAHALHLRGQHGSASGNFSKAKRGIFTTT